MQHPNRAAGPKETTVTTITAFFIPADPNTPMRGQEVRRFDEDGLCLPDLYAVIGCSLVEAVHVDGFVAHGGMSLWCDEEALCKGDPELNLRASCLAGRRIYGNALLISEDVYGYSRSWDAEQGNPLPFVPCELERLSRQVAQSMIDWV